MLIKRTLELPDRTCDIKGQCGNRCVKGILLSLQTMFIIWVTWEERVGSSVLIKASIKL